MKFVTKDQLESWAEKAASQYLDKGISLNDSIEKIAQENLLNEEQVRRVSEFANISTNLELFEREEDKRFEFPQADSSAIWSKVSSDSSHEKTASIFSDYLLPPSRRYIPNQETEKVASEQVIAKSQDELIEEIEKTGQAIKELEMEKMAAEMSHLNAEQDLYDQVKQVVLNGDFTFKEVCACALQHADNPSRQGIVKEALLKAGYNLVQNDFALEKQEVIKLAEAVPEDYIADSFDSPSLPIMIRNGNLNLYYTLDTLVKQKERVSDYDKPLLHLNDNVRYVKRTLVDY
jgi:hypothetical protein